jgi:hypothetical protein
VHFSMGIIREGLGSASFGFLQFHLKSFFILEKNGISYCIRDVESRNCTVRTYNTVIHRSMSQYQSGCAVHRTSKNATTGMFKTRSSLYIFDSKKYKYYIYTTVCSITLSSVFFTCYSYRNFYFLLIFYGKSF